MKQWTLSPFTEKVILHLSAFYNILLFNLSVFWRQPVNIILESPINKAGRLQAVYVNSGSSNGYYEVKGHAKVPIGPKGFQQMWRKLNLLCLHCLIAMHTF